MYKRRKNMFKIFTTEDERNVVTNFYIDVLVKAIKSIGQNAKNIVDVSEIEHEKDSVVTVTAISAIKAYKYGAKHIINWWQGIHPEESYYRNINKTFLERKLRFLVLSHIEKKAIEHTSLNLFVSKSMQQHFAFKYGYKNDNYVIMPCFNELLQKNCFGDTRYIKPTFVYAGGLSRWQCFEPMVKLFSKIKQKLPDATLALYVKDCLEVHEILEKYGVSADIKFVSQSQLTEEMKKYKYGFIIRDDDILNRVATPTKMNSYMASGVIPIYTDVIDSFKENLSAMQYAVPLQFVKDNADYDIEPILSLEKKEIKGADVEKEYQPIFETFYNADYYIPRIAEKIKEMVKLDV